MNIIKKLLGNNNEKESQKEELKEIEGRVDIREPLATYSITHNFVSLSNLISYDTLLLLSEELNVPLKVVKDDLIKLTKGMIHDLTVCIEYPYVDETYRDTYYSFYARKHTGYNRYCFRLSFFRLR